MENYVKTKIKITEQKFNYKKGFIMVNVGDI